MAKNSSSIILFSDLRASALSSGSICGRNCLAIAVKIDDQGIAGFQKCQIASEYLLGRLLGIGTDVHLGSIEQHVAVLGEDGLYGEFREPLLQL